MCTNTLTFVVLLDIYVLYLQEEFEELKKHLANAVDESKSKEEIVQLLKETFHNRRTNIKDYNGRIMYRLCKDYKALKNADYVSNFFLT